MATYLLIVGLAGFLYPVAVYPILIFIAARLFPDPLRKVSHKAWSRVTVLIPVYNEEAVIEEKIRNTLALDYPPDCLEVIVASDGSSDRTVALSRAIKDPRLIVVAFPERSGKLATLKRAMRLATGEIVALTDASASLLPEALRKVVDDFRDPRVGCVSGRYRAREKGDTAPDGRGVAEQNYFEFEVFLRRQESLLASTLGAHGAFYAIRRNLFPHSIGAHIINDDFVIPMMILEKGYRTVYESEAVVVERHETSVDGELKRRIRISTGNLQQILLLAKFLSPHYGWISFIFWSHKVIRSFQPVYLLLILLAPFLTGTAWGRSMGLFEVLFYGLGFLAVEFKVRKKILALPLYFVLTNMAMLAGFRAFIRSRSQNPVRWEKV